MNQPALSKHPVDDQTFPQSIEERAMHWASYLTDKPLLVERLILRRYAQQRY